MICGYIRVRSCRRCFTAIPRTLAAYIATWMSKQTYVLGRECSYWKMLFCDTSRSTWRFCAMPAEKQKSLFFLTVNIEVAMWTRLWLVESSATSSNDYSANNISNQSGTIIHTTAFKFAAWIWYILNLGPSLIFTPIIFTKSLIKVNKSFNLFLYLFLYKVCILYNFVVWCIFLFK